jgi:hypothetical protein
VLNRPPATLSNLGQHARFRVKDGFAPVLPGVAKAMLVVIVGLAAILAAEILHGSDATPQSDSIGVPLARLPSIAPDGRSSSRASVSTSLEIAASTILSRPLFVPDRRPVPLGARAPEAVVMEPSAKLVGTIISDRVRIAFLEQAGKQTALLVGDRVGSSRIIGIQPTRIRLQSSDGQMNEVRLSWGTYIEPTPRPPLLEPSHLAFHLEK